MIFFYFIILYKKYNLYYGQIHSISCRANFPLVEWLNVLYEVSTFKEGGGLVLVQVVIWQGAILEW